MFFTIKSGEDDIQIFNADCMARHLVESIFKRCKCKPNDQLAVVDEECSGAVINLSKMSNSRENCCDQFKDREVYVLLAVTNEGGRAKEDIYTPLLNDEFINPVFSIRLEALTAPMKRASTFSVTSKKPGMKKKMKIQKTKYF